MTETFGQMLRRLRMARGMSKYRLYERSGVSHANVYMMEAGQRRAPRPQTVAMLAIGLGLDEQERRAFFAAAMRDHARPYEEALAALMPR